MSRMMIFHYFTPWYYLYLIQLHVVFCHESWDSDSGETTYEDKSGSYISWFYDAFLKEIQDAWYATTLVYLYFYIHHFHPGTVSYSFFERWNIAELDEIRFYGVAPHWYFRPMMGLLVIAPTHYEGLMWMGLFFALLAFLPTIYNCYNYSNRALAIIPMQSSVLQSALFAYFLLSLFCVASILPCGRYYYEPEGGYVGNTWIKFSFQYVYLYLIWIVHNVDLVEHWLFQFGQKLHRFWLKLYTRGALRMHHNWRLFNNSVIYDKHTTKLTVWGDQIIVTLR